MAEPDAKRVRRALEDDDINFLTALDPQILYSIALDFLTLPEIRKLEEALGGVTWHFSNDFWMAYFARRFDGVLPELLQELGVTQNDINVRRLLWAYTMYIDVMNSIGEPVYVILYRDGNERDIQFIPSQQDIAFTHQLDGEFVDNLRAIVEPYGNSVEMIYGDRGGLNIRLYAGNEEERDRLPQDYQILFIKIVMAFLAHGYKTNILPRLDGTTYYEENFSVNSLICTQCTNDALFKERETPENVFCSEECQKEYYL